MYWTEFTINFHITFEEHVKGQDLWITIVSILTVIPCVLVCLKSIYRGVCKIACLACFVSLRACVLAYSAYLRPYVLACLCDYVLGMFAYSVFACSRAWRTRLFDMLVCLRASVLPCFCAWRACVFDVLACSRPWRAFVLCVLTCLLWWNVLLSYVFAWLACLTLEYSEIFIFRQSKIFMQHIYK